ncbi:MAG: proline dehydrogenase family protein [Bacteroidota bacterium]|nr:proline dehydrogenase family protein [Bacteroidota bacterium]MDP4230864.1 proline dehydrogenase family protein [Bacteroidota bacterium]MDP4236316.1 proline dehydrogenase family protein [Bacteroidota bacterium]
MNLFNKLIAAALPIIPKGIVRKVSARYIAGDTLTDAVRVVRTLNAEGAMATVDVLGEYITSLSDAETNTKYSCEVLKTIEREKIDSNLSIKLTSLGLDLDAGHCEKNVRTILETARGHGNIFVRFDMENSPYTSRTLELHDKLKGEFNIGVVLQAYMRRSEDDIRTLIANGSRNIRLCKGIYNESETIAFKGRDEIRANYLRCLELALSNGLYVGIATHDPFLIAGAKEIITKLKLPRERYEFQMLLGVTEPMRRSLIKEGFRLRVYVPFGADWYGYSIRRLKENPAMAGHITKAIFTGR